MPTRSSLSPLALLLALTGCGGAGGSPDAGTDAAPPGDDGLTVFTTSGPVHGALDDRTRTFLGLPYAAPPVGALRFAPPVAPSGWKEVREATDYGHECAQAGLTGQFAPSSSEDCLYLNVYAPAAPSSSTGGAKRPVMVFIHGGAFVLGAGSDPSFVGTSLSQAGDVIVVTLNYRLGALGFLAHAALDSEDPTRATSGNYGLLDQQAALAWVQQNAAAFGGDPANVTVFGESAGAFSTCFHLVAAGSRGLFARAIIESGYCTLPVVTRTAFEAQGVTLATALGCTGDDAAVRACLRGKTAAEVTTALPQRADIIGGAGYSFGPVVDGLVLEDQPRALLEKDGGAKVPLIVGANGDEGTLFFALGLHLTSEADARDTLGSLFSPTQVDAILRQYPIAGFSSWDAAGIQMLGDVMVCEARRVARLHAAAGGATFEYDFTHPFAWIYPNLGAFHSAELPFVWGNPYEFVALTPDELPLSRAMQGYWTRFATGGDPGGDAAASAPAWPAYDAKGDVSLKLDLPIVTGTGLRSSTCDFWDAL